MAERKKRLPVHVAGERYEGWMPFVDDRPVMMPLPGTAWPPCAEVYATRTDARKVAEDVRHVAIIVTKGKR